METLIAEVRDMYRNGDDYYDIESHILRALPNIKDADFRAIMEAGKCEPEPEPEPEPKPEPKHSEWLRSPALPGYEVKYPCFVRTIRRRGVPSKELTLTHTGQYKISVRDKDGNRKRSHVSMKNVFRAWQAAANAETGRCT